MQNPYYYCSAENMAFDPAKRSAKALAACQAEHAPMDLRLWAHNHLANLDGLTPTQEAVLKAVFVLDVDHGGAPYRHSRYDAGNTGTPCDLIYRGQRMLKADADGNTHCAGATYAAFIGALERMGDAAVFTTGDVAALRKYFFVSTPDATAGIAKGIMMFAPRTDWAIQAHPDGLQVGDFAQLCHDDGVVQHSFVCCGDVMCWSGADDAAVPGYLVWSSNYATGLGFDFFRKAGRLFRAGRLA